VRVGGQFAVLLREYLRRGARKGPSGTWGVGFLCRVTAIVEPLMDPQPASPDRSSRDWGFDVDQVKTLGAYFAANRLLVDCLDVA
jgi:hypothetical protein